MSYTYEPIADTTLYELRTGNIIFVLDSAETAYAKMLADFNDPSNIETFVALLNNNPSTAFAIYNNL